MSIQKSVGLFAITLGIVFSASSLFAHCQIPCGIYNDSLRIELIKEHAGTIEKSMTMIKTLESESPVNMNQLVRWIQNKDDHAEKIQEIVTQYFMTQRIKPPVDEKGNDKYFYELGLLHQILVQAMKCKQSTDVKELDKLRAFLLDFEKSYFEEHQH